MSSFKRILTGVLTLALCLMTFAGCAGDAKNAAVSMENGGSVSVSFMYLLASIQKNMYAATGIWWSMKKRGRRFPIFCMK